MWRGLINSENLKYEMHRNALENVLQNILAAAQESDYYESLEDDDLMTPKLPRSIATLAKNGQLPSKEPDTEMGSLSDDDNGHKRNLASMARSGLIGGKRNIQSLARQWNNGKRNIGSVKQQFPGSGKRNMASLARNGFGKRNVGALARDWSLPKFNTGSKNMDFSGATGQYLNFYIHQIFKNHKFQQILMTDGKRNIQAMKNSIKNGRRKRDISGDMEALEPVYQINGPLDYEELFQSLNEEYPYLMQNQEKRFLGE